MDYWSDSDKEENRCSLQSSAKISQDLFSERISQYSLNFDFPCSKELSHTVDDSDELVKQLENDEELFSGANTDWLSLSEESANRLDIRDSTNKQASPSAKQSADNSVKDLSTSPAKSAEASQIWSSSFPCVVEENSLQTLSPDKTQQTRCLPDFSFLKDASANSTKDSTFSVQQLSKPPSAGKRLGSRFSYPKRSPSVSANSDSQLDVNLDAIQLPAVTKGGCSSNKVAAGYSESPGEMESPMELVIGLLQTDNNSTCNDETIMTMASATSAASDATVYAPASLGNSTSQYNDGNNHVAASSQPDEATPQEKVVETPPIISPVRQTIASRQMISISAVSESGDIVYASVDESGAGKGDSVLSPSIAASPHPSERITSCCRDSKNPVSPLTRSRIKKMAANRKMNSSASASTTVSIPVRESSAKHFERGLQRVRRPSGGRLGSPDNSVDMTTSDEDEVAGIVTRKDSASPVEPCIDLSLNEENQRAGSCQVPAVSPSALLDLPSQCEMPGKTINRKILSEIKQLACDGNVQSVDNISSSFHSQRNSESNSSPVDSLLSSASTPKDKENLEQHTHKSQKLITKKQKNRPSSEVTNSQVIQEDCESLKSELFNQKENADSHDKVDVAEPVGGNQSGSRRSARLSRKQRNASSSFSTPSVSNADDSLTSPSTNCDQVAKKNKRTHNYYRHERLVIEDVALPISQLNSSENVKSLLEFLEDTATALQPIGQSPTTVTRISPETTQYNTSLVDEVMSCDLKHAESNSAKLSNLSQDELFGPVEIPVDSEQKDVSIQVDDSTAGKCAEPRSSPMLLLKTRKQEKTNQIETKSSTKRGQPTVAADGSCGHKQLSAQLEGAETTATPHVKKRKFDSVELKPTTISESERQSPSKAVFTDVQRDSAKLPTVETKTRKLSKSATGTKRSQSKSTAKDNSPLDDSFELLKNRKLVKKEPIWLARYTVARDRKSGDRKPGDKQAQGFKGKGNPSKAEAVFNLFNRSYSGKRYREPSAICSAVDATSTQTRNSGESGPANLMGMDHQKEVDSSVYDFIPSQPSPVKTTKSKQSKLNKSNKSKKPRRNSKAMLAQKKALIKQLNENWGISVPSVADSEVIDGESALAGPVISQATAMERHFNDIVQNVSLTIEDAPQKKHCTFEGYSDNKIASESTLSARAKIRKNGEQAEFVNKRTETLPSKSHVSNESVELREKSTTKPVLTKKQDGAENVERDKILPACDIKTEIGPDDTSPSSIQVTHKPVQSDVRSFLDTSTHALPPAKLAVDALTTASPSPLVRPLRRSLKPIIDDSDTQTDSQADSQKGARMSTKLDYSKDISCLQATLSPVLQTRRSRSKLVISSGSESSLSSDAPKKARAQKQNINAKLSQKQKKGNNDTVKMGKENDKKVAVEEVVKKGPVIKQFGRPTRNTQIGTKLVFTCTSLTKEQRRMVDNCAKIMDADVVQSYTPQVTHVLTSMDASSCCPRTLKYMLAVLEAKWVVNIEWASFCLEQSKHLPEEIFEVVGSTIAPKSSASIISRQHKLKGIPRLFAGCEFYLAGDFTASSPSREHIIQLIEAGGAKKLNRLPRVASQTAAYHAEESSVLSKSGCVVISADQKITFKLSGVSLVTPSWLLDSIAHYRLMPVEQYSLQSDM